MNIFEYEGYGHHKKDQHMGFARQFYTEESFCDFVETRFVHQSLPELKLEDVDASSQIAGFTSAKPFFVNAMTGGTKKAYEINQYLGIMANISKFIVASGSVSEAIKDPSVADSFTILRRENPYGTIFANLGAHHDVDNAKRAVDLLEANALQVHLNAPQEIIMYDGDRDFSMWLTNIEKLVRELEVPVIVKEVGFGMSRETVAKLQSVGVKTVDVAGAGGTDFVRIENARKVFQQYREMNGWGQSAIISLLEANSLPEENRPQIIASGGVKNPLDAVKCLALGADMVGLSTRILRMLTDPSSVEPALEDIRLFHRQIEGTMALLGAKSIADLRKTDLIVAPSVQQWAEARHLDWKQYANRSRETV